MTGPEPLHDRALANLQYIRSAMERAGSFTAVPGWGMVAVGTTALVAAWLAHQTGGEASWLRVWLAEGVLAFGLGSGALLHKARRGGDPVLSGPGRRFGLSFLPSLLVGPCSPWRCSATPIRRPRRARSRGCGCSVTAQGL